MATKKISELTALTAPDGAEELVVNDGGTSKKITIDNTIKSSFPNITTDVTATTAELNYVDGVTSAIQTQIDSKLNLSGGTMTGNIVLGTNTVGGLQITTTATSNIGLGAGAVDSITTGDYNVGVGDNALTNNTTGINNTASGYRALYNNISGYQNTASGYKALYSNTTGYDNTASGYVALYNNISGNYNTASGYRALYNNISGSNNTCIGFDAGRSTSPSGTITTQSNRVCIGDNSVTNAYVKVSWTVTSDERDKADIVEMPHGLDVVSNITPINYVWDNRSDYENETSDGTKKQTGNLRTGFSAQNVKAALDGVGYSGNSVVDSEDEEHLKLTETNLIPFLVNSIKELSAENKALLARIEALETI